MMVDPDGNLFGIKIDLESLIQNIGKWLEISIEEGEINPEYFLQRPNIYLSWNSGQLGDNKHSTVSGDSRSYDSDLEAIEFLYNAGVISYYKSFSKREVWNDMPPKFRLGAMLRKYGDGYIAPFEATQYTCYEYEIVHEMYDYTKIPKIQSQYSEEFLRNYYQSQPIPKGMAGMLNKSYSPMHYYKYGGTTSTTFRVYNPTIEDNNLLSYDRRNASNISNYGIGLLQESMIQNSIMNWVNGLTEPPPDIVNWPSFNSVIAY